jgi:hypothetical protein
MYVIYLHMYVNLHIHPPINFLHFSSSTHFSFSFLLFRFFPALGVGGWSPCSHVPRVLPCATYTLATGLITGWMRCRSNSVHLLATATTTTTTTCACTGKIQGSTIVFEGTSVIWRIFCLSSLHEAPCHEVFLVLMTFHLY